jgi:thiamine-phosphate pyrophosphorylase
LEEINAKAKKIIEYKKEKSFVFIINDYPGLAVEVGADGVHIGQDFSISKARQIIGSRLILGKSTHSIEQGLRAQADGADYISVGPVFSTPTKLGRKAVGLEYVRQAASLITIPMVAIGGINLSNINEVLQAGAKTIGVVRAASEAPQLLKILCK